ncbi:hypothetical protein FQN57_000639 [Myotisia sp. PD_48]|nr:hypothetical protein FQN57_000639 [Myotisia sp. PD_48]
MSDLPNREFPVGNPEQLTENGSLDAEYEQLSSYPDSNDYYSLLSLPRDPPPTDAAVRSAYRTLSLSFHPDKQPPQLQDTAVRHFEEIRRAYETLIDPQKRVIYDMMGREGVEREYSPAGLMRREGKEIGVKAMDKNQFRDWFLAKMKKQERRVLEEFVQSKGTVDINIDARSMFWKEDTDGPTYVSLPNPRFSSFYVGFRFSIPFSPYAWFNDSNDDHDEGEGNKNKSDPETAAEVIDEIPLLEINAGIGGRLQPLTRKITYVDPETQEEKTIEANLPPILLSDKFTVGASLQHHVTKRTLKTGPLNKYLFPILGESYIGASTSILPAPSVSTFIVKDVTLIEGTSPFNVTVQSHFSNSLLLRPPVFGVAVSRNIGFGKVLYCNWSSGDLAWPSLVAQYLQYLWVSPDGVSVSFPSQGKFELGFNSVNRKAAGQDPAEQKKSDPVESWGVLMHASPMSQQLTVNYSRSLFSSSPEQPALSEWNYEGYHPRKKVDNDRSVKLEISTSVSSDLSLGWMVSGFRRVGNFTRVGLGIGVQGQKGLVCSILWNRLGQNLKMPILVCPAELVDADIATVVVAIPCLIYSIVEFGILRPGRRRKQRKEISRQRKRVQRIIAKRKQESLEAISLMTEQVSRRQDIAEQRGGLVILYAEYGYVPPVSRRIFREGEAEDQRTTIDVTIPVAALVDQDQLNIPSSIPKSEIIGFSDPAPFMPKKLRIRYRFRGETYLVEAMEGEGILVPMRSHLE